MIEKTVEAIMSHDRPQLRQERETKLDSANRAGRNRDNQLSHILCNTSISQYHDLPKPTERVIHER